MHSLIKNFKTCLVSSINKISKEIKIRTRNILFKDVIYYSALLIANNTSYDSINSHLKINNILNVTKTALIRFKNNVDSNYFEKINYDLLKHIYKHNTKRIIAVDGTYVMLNKILVKDSFYTNKNNYYCTALISTIFDVNLEMPINYKLDIDCCERTTLIKQLKYINAGDIVIMDRGYYSKEMLFKLDDLKIKVLFRLVNKLLFLRKLTKKINDVIVTLTENDKSVKFRLLKYLIGNETYYLGTTIYNENINYFKDLYWKRWKVEINFKYSKYNLSMNNLKSKSKNSLIQDICIHNFIFIVSAYLLSIDKTDIKKNYKINISSHLEIIVNNILYLLIYKNNIKSNIDEILRILQISKNNIIYAKSNRSFPRIRKKPSSKWCPYGNKYKRNC